MKSTMPESKKPKRAGLDLNLAGAVNAANKAGRDAKVVAEIRPAYSAMSGASAQSSDSETLDHIAHAALARAIKGLSPAARMLAYFDWAIHLAISPGKQGQLAGKALRKQQRHIGKKE